MSDNLRQNPLKERSPIRLPTELTLRESAWPIVFVDTTGVDITQPQAQGKVNQALKDALRGVHSDDISGQALLKVHIGEPKCDTRMKPEYVVGSVEFLRGRGVETIAAGDTTVAYSGPRGHKQNPTGDVSTYVGLARRHGWSPQGSAGVPFVVLDRPCSARAGRFQFANSEKRAEMQGIRRFEDFYLAGGFAAADFVINHAHLTLHGLAGLAGCVKSIAMGCSALKGKLRMHQSLLPKFDSELCASCGQCVDSCPENALVLKDRDAAPAVDPEACIGCGECEAICPEGAVRLRGQEITDWQRGQDTLPLRMADYTMGLMSQRWACTIHVLHMYTITERCDCLNVRQRPMLKRDLGFLVGKNPFAIDRLAGRMLADALCNEGRDTSLPELMTAERSAAYVQGCYGILSETPLERMLLE